MMIQISKLSFAALAFMAPLQTSTPHVSHRHAAPEARARVLVDSAIIAMGGIAELRAVPSIRVEGAQHDYLAGNAERADGPWKTAYTHYAELADLSNLRLRRRTIGTSRFFATPQERTVITSDTAAASILPDGKQIAAQVFQYEDAIDHIDTDPVRALQLALAAPDLVRDPPDTLYREIYDGVSFARRGGRMRILLDRHTRLPGAIVILRAYPDDPRRGPFGDIHLMTVFAEAGRAVGLMVSDAINRDREWGNTHRSIRVQFYRECACPGRFVRHNAVDTRAVSRDPAEVVLPTQAWRAWRTGRDPRRDCEPP